MVDKTPNQDLEKPEEHETDWGIAIRNTYDKLDKILQGFSSDGKSLDIEIGSIGKTKHISEGADLGQVVADALSDGVASLHIHEPADGSQWSWDSNITHDTDTDGPLEIIIGRNVEIEYTGSGRPLTLEDSSGSGTDRDTSVRVAGGQWTASGSPAGWVRIDDLNGYHLAPDYVDFGASATAIEVRNVDGFSELGIIEGVYKAGNGIDFVPASVTGGSGTDSFQGTTLRDVRVNVQAAGGFGMRFRGNMRYCHIRRPNIFPNNDNARAFVFGTNNALNMVITAAQAESSAGTGTIGVETMTDFNRSQKPVFVGFQAAGSIDTPAVLNDGADALPNFDAEGEKLALSGIGGSNPLLLTPSSGAVSIQNTLSRGNTALSGDQVEFNGGYAKVIGNAGLDPLVVETTDSGSRIEMRPGGSTEIEFYENGVISHNPVDVTTISSPSQGYTAYNDGTTGTEGPAFYNGTDWISQVDGTTIS